VVIGAVAGVLLVWSVSFVERTLRIDDPVGAISVHGVNGAWGVLSLGLLADGKYGDGFNGVPGTVTGLFYGDSSQFMAQMIGCATNILWVFSTSFIAFKIIGALIGNRVSAEVELQGLDIPEMGILGYPEVLTGSHSLGLPSHGTSGELAAQLSMAKETAQG
jgi:Amt family ammonium transporter